jgi:hypothetical protein
MEMLKSIHDHETSMCMCARTNVFGPKAVTPSWPWGRSMSKVGRVGDWLGFLANRNGHTFQRSVLLRPDTLGCFQLVFCGHGPETIELLDWSQQTVPQDRLTEVDYSLTQLTLV